MGSPAGTVVTVGTFDGVHLGHRRVLEEIAVRARRAHRKSMLVTFEPHPMEVVNPEAAPRLLTMATERREILAQSELDVVVFMAFTRALSQYPPEAFVRLLLDRFQMQELVIGYDHGFGKGREGNVVLLRALGGRLGFAVDVVGEVDVGGRSVSSTLVRRAVAGGDLETARRLLGRLYSASGTVVPGSGRGRTIGYRTVNLSVANSRKLLPPDGVYAVHAEWDGGSAGGMMHLGPRPTFGERRRTIEAHLFGVADDLYGQAVKMSWVARLRDVRSFPSPAALRAQLDRDVVAAQAALTGPQGFDSH